MSVQAAIDAVLAAELPAESGRADRLLPVLHEIQHRLGYVPEAAVAPLARRFNLSRADVHGVIGYYKHFRRRPAGRHVLQLCQAEACQSMGADALREHLERRVGCSLGSTDAAGQVSLEAVYCLGQCAAAPALMVDDEPHARITVDRLDALLAGIAARDGRGSGAGNGAGGDADRRGGHGGSAQ